MKRVISASRRTDLVASFPEWLARSLAEGRAAVFGPARKTVLVKGRAFAAEVDPRVEPGAPAAVDVRPESVHTVVLWSKDFSNLIRDEHGLLRAFERYDQIYLLFTITGLGGTFIERGVIEPEAAFAQLPDLVRVAGSPRRVSVRFDPVVHWREAGETRTNLGRFADVAARTASAGIEDVRISFAQWYGKAVRRAARYGFDYVDPDEGRKLAAAARLVETASKHGLRLYSCSQDFLTRVPGIKRSSCIDGALLGKLHPRQERASVARDKTQRKECGCTTSIDIGSYAQSCPHACLYCYANPKEKYAGPVA